MNNRITITEVAKAVGVTPRTIMRWEKAGKIRKSKRDWRGWRFYYEEDIEEIKKFVDTCYEYNGENGTLVDVTKGMLIIAIIVTAALAISICGPAYAGTSNFAPKRAVAEQAITETPSSVDIYLDALPAVAAEASAITEDTKYTLGPNDVIAIEVRRHPEFSGQYPINSEGKIEYKFVGDVVVRGLTKAELNERLTKILSEYIIEPDVDVMILAYLSKVFYVVGEVGRPGKFYMRGNTVSVREALVQAGLPAHTAALKGCRLITPSKAGSRNYVTVNAMSLLYEGNLKENRDMKPGDVLYVPATVMAKIIRVVSPVTNIAGQAAGTAAKGLIFVP
jgi:protein involved in polysaccharide export with SLBB domain